MTTQAVAPRPKRVQWRWCSVQPQATALDTVATNEFHGRERFTDG
jgi:hypothetical protein